jgi:Family of unknown function (DUF5519)
MMDYLNEFREQVSSWPGVSMQPPRFGGMEFSFGSAETGHIHPDGILDISMTRAIHDVVLEEGLAEQLRWLPDSGFSHAERKRLEVMDCGSRASAISDTR